jgi:tRNA threonylcarbamoyladenosine biosynthesis protein TsaE
MIVKSLEETKKFAQHLVQELKGGEVILLRGDLGSGKTTFVRFVAELLNIDVKVKSPSFSVMNEYPVQHRTITRILHLDLYRFNDAEHLQALALEDELRLDTVIFIEWPDAVDALPIEATKTIEFTFIDESTREISYG